MKAIEPIEITDFVLTSTNVVEDDLPLWNSGTDYEVGIKVMMTDGVHRRYECMVANTNEDPSLDENLYNDEVDPVDGYWKDLGATNAHKMFDNKTGSKTERSGQIVVVLRPDVFYDSLSFFGLEASKVTVEMNDTAEGLVYSREYDLIDLEDITDIYSWCFYPLERKEDFVLLDLPPYVTGILTVTIDNGSDTARCGNLVVGRQIYVGKMKYSTKVGMESYSRKTTDDDGEPIIEKRRTAKTVDYDVTMPKGRVNKVREFLEEHESQGIVYIGNESMPETIVFGFLHDFNIVLNGPVKSKVSIEVEELS